MFDSKLDHCSYATPSSANGDPSNNGKQCPKCNTNDPISTANGNNFRTDTDYASKTPGGLVFSRTYNSNGFSTDAGLKRYAGASWTTPFDRAAERIYNPLDSASQPKCYSWNDDPTSRFCIEPPHADLNGIRFVRSDGKSIAFGFDGARWVGAAYNGDIVTPSLAADGVTITGWTYFNAATDQTERYFAYGKLQSITTRAGTVQTMTYSDGNSNDTALGRLPSDAPVCPNVQLGAVLPANTLMCVTDSWGHQLQFEYDASRRISKMIDPDNRNYLYTYDGPSGGCTTPDNSNAACVADNLTQVTYPDGNTTTYWYNEKAHISSGQTCGNFAGVAPGFGGLVNAMTGIDDENGVRYATWDYECSGRAVGNQLAGGVNHSTLAFGDPATQAPTTTVTDIVGTADNPQTNVHKFGFKTLSGVLKLASTDQPCTECGSVASYEYDNLSNVISATDFKGIVTTYEYRSGPGRETSHTEAAGTPQARTISTEWHPKFRLPTRITEPGRVTTLAYDGSGNLLSKTVTASGVSRSWSYTYTTLGQILTATGPRKDVADVTTYTYDTGGNLSTVKNAAGHLTTLSNYDASGRVGLITEANGTSTALSYSPRGWLRSKVVSAGTIVQSTGYDYDAVGNLSKVTLPDNSSISYSYDPAHRLTSIQDSNANSINYTLDLWGNRVGERVTDSNGALTRQVRRIYDTVNRLQQVTGAAQ